MIVILAIDDTGGMMFHGRRQSCDRVLRKKILHITKEKKLWMNSYSAKQFVETEGKEQEGILFHVYCYNVQPGIEIDYETGKSWLSEEGSKLSENNTSSDREEKYTYILNTNSKKFHLENCSGTKRMKKENKEEYTGSREELISQGYEPCKSCNP